MLPIFILAVLLGFVTSSNTNVPGLRDTVEEELKPLIDKLVSTKLSMVQDSQEKFDSKVTAIQDIWLAIRQVYAYNDWTQGDSWKTEDKEFREMYFAEVKDLDRVIMWSHEHKLFRQRQNTKDCNDKFDRFWCSYKTRLLYVKAQSQLSYYDIDEASRAEINKEMTLNLNFYWAELSDQYKQPQWPSKLGTAEQMIQSDNEMKKEVEYDELTGQQKMDFMWNQYSFRMDVQKPNSDKCEKREVICSDKDRKYILSLMNLGDYFRQSADGKAQLDVERELYEGQFKSLSALYRQQSWPSDRLGTQEEMLKSDDDHLEFMNRKVSTFPNWPVFDFAANIRLLKDQQAFRLKQVQDETCKNGKNTSQKFVYDQRMTLLQETYCTDEQRFPMIYGMLNYYNIDMTDEKQVSLVHTMQKADIKLIDFWSKQIAILYRIMHLESIDAERDAKERTLEDEKVYMDKLTDFENWDLTYQIRAYFWLFNFRFQNFLHCALKDDPKFSHFETLCNNSGNILDKASTYLMKQGSPENGYYFGLRGQAKQDVDNVIDDLYAIEGKKNDGNEPKPTENDGNESNPTENDGNESKPTENDGNEPKPTENADQCDLNNKDNQVELIEISEVTSSPGDNGTTANSAFDGNQQTSFVAIAKNGEPVFFEAKMDSFYTISGVNIRTSNNYNDAILLQGANIMLGQEKCGQVPEQVDEGTCYFIKCSNNADQGRGKLEDTKPITSNAVRLESSIGLALSDIQIVKSKEQDIEKIGIAQFEQERYDTNGKKGYRCEYDGKSTPKNQQGTRPRCDETEGMCCGVAHAAEDTNKIPRTQMEICLPMDLTEYSYKPNWNARPVQWVFNCIDSAQKVIFGSAAILIVGLSICI